jgi:hypothetical protein
MLKPALLALAMLVSGGCRSRPGGSVGAQLDSTQFVARAFAAYDSARVVHDTLKHVVHAFVRIGDTVIVSLWPASSGVQGGSGDVLFNAGGRVLAVRLYQ